MMGCGYGQGGSRIHGPDWSGQAWNVTYGQGVCSSTVEMPPGSLDVARWRRTWPSTLSLSCPPHSCPTLQRQLFHSYHYHLLHLQFRFLAWTPFTSTDFHLRRQPSPSRSDALDLCILGLPMPWICTPFPFRCLSLCSIFPPPSPSTSLCF